MDPSETVPGTRDDVQELRRRVDEAETEVDNLREALKHSRAIGAAIGILVERLHIDEATAFQRLSTLSQHTNRKVRDIADELLLTGQLPENETRRLA